MADEFCFLGSSDAEEFAGRYEQRYVAGYPIRPERQLPVGDEVEKNLLESVSSCVRRHQHATASVSNWFECCSISVRHNDGLSWSAEAVRRKLASEFPQFQQVCLPVQSGNEHRQQIRELMGDKAFLRRAVEYKFQPPAVHWLLRHIPLLSSTVIVSLMYVVGSLISTSGAQPYLARLTSSRWGIGAAIAAVLVLSFVAKKLDGAGGRSKSSEELDAELWKKLAGIAQQSSEPADFKRFIETLARDLSHAESPRIVMVDDFERLDIVSRRIVEEYVGLKNKEGAASELWVIFEREDGPGLRKAAFYEPSDSEFFDIHCHWYALVPVSERRRKELAEKLGHPETARYSTIRGVCEGGVDNQRYIADELRHFREEHPRSDQQLDPLTLLYLLAATAEAGDIHFTVFELRPLLAVGVKDNLRAGPLQLLLRRPSRDISVDAFKEVEKQLKFFVRSEGEVGTKKWKLQSTAEVAEQMESHTAKLDLGSPGLVHLYWSLFWYDNAYANLEAFKLRKLVHHLGKADLGGCPEAMQDELRPQLFEAALFTCKELHANCIFEDAALENAITYAFRFFESATAVQRTAWRDRLMQRCWEGYSILGSDSILDHIFQISQEDLREDAIAEVSSEAVTPGTLFFATLGLTSEARDVLVKEIAPQTKAERRFAATARDFAFARASWLNASVLPLLSTPANSHVLLRYSGLEDLKPLNELIERCRMRLTGNKQKEDPRAIDVAIASHCLWSVSLIFCQSDSVTQEDWNVFKSMVDTALLVASEMKKESSSSGKDMVVNALARELSALAVASLAVAWLAGKAPADADISELSTQVAFGEAIFGLPLSERGLVEAMQFDKLSLNLDSLLTLCAFVWNQLGLDEMCVSAHIRKHQFSYLRNLSHAGTLKMGKETTEIFSASNSRTGYINILANYVAASCYSESGELVAHYVREAASAGSSTGCSPRLLAEMSLLAIYHGHHLNTELASLLAPLIKGGVSDSYLSGLIGRLTEQEFQDLSLIVLNCTLKLKDPVSLGVLEEIIEGGIQKMLPGPKRENVAALLDYFRLRWRVMAGERLPPDRAVLQEWEGRKHLSTYLDILRILLGDGEASAEVTAEALTLINGETVSDNGRFLLAFALLKKRPKEQSAIEAIVTSLSFEINRWESRNSVEVNIDTFRFLKQQSGAGRAVYTQNAYLIDAKLDKWEKIRIERDHVVRLKNYVASNRYVFLMQTYCSWAWYWNLKFDVPFEAGMALLNADEEVRRRALRSWKDNGSVVPNPLVYGSREEVYVSSKFLSLASYLFETPFDQEMAWEQDRMHFNKAARDSWHQLIDVVLKLNQLPSETRTLLKYHTQLLSQYEGDSMQKEGVLAPTGYSR